MIDLPKNIAAMRPSSIPISVLTFVWNDTLYQTLEFLN